MLSIRNLHAQYGLAPVLKGISLDVEAGEVVALIGANGAGKTTTLMTISGIVPSRSGTITFCGEDIQGLPPHEIVKKGICQVPEGRRIFPRLSVLENLEMGAYLQTGAKEREEDFGQVFSLFPILRERRFQQGGTLSGGEQQMLAIGRALMSRPKLLLLDEPSLGLSPLMAQKIFEMIKEISRQGKTILLVEQNARAALTLADRGYVMETGQIVLTGAAGRLLENPDVQTAYLGKL
ncbi:MAG TPA: ABC transporter ATP-binding protein [Candidatus Manganitrophaceae bacterium]|nr:ABC transporter ATP-binding protein [Candidatus Manganitrophaceae bacterium]